MNIDREFKGIIAFNAKRAKMKIADFAVETKLDTRAAVAAFAVQHGWTVKFSSHVENGLGEMTDQYECGEYHCVVKTVNDVVTYAEKGTRVTAWHAEGNAYSGPELLNIVGMMLEDTE